MFGPPFVRLYNFIKSNAYLLTALFCLVSTAIILFIKLKFLISYHPDISGSERSTTYGIQIVADKLTLYGDPEKSPFWIAQYSPFYYYVVGLPYRWLGWDPTDIHKIQLVSRIASFAIVSLAMLVVFLTGRKIARLSLVSSILFCSVVFGFLQHWPLTNSRIDSLLFLCTVSFIYCSLKAFDTANTTAKSSGNYLLAAAAFAVFAFFSKQSGLIHIFILLAFLALQQRWRDVFKVAGFMGILALVLALAFSGGELRLFVINLFGSLVVPIMPGWFYYWTFKPLIPAASVLIAVCFLINLKWLFANQDNRQYQFLALASFLFFGFATATTFKYGAAVGYYHEFTYTGILTVFWYFCRYDYKRSTQSLSYYLFPAMVAATMLYFVSNQIEKYTDTNFRDFALAHAQQKEVKEYVLPQLADNDKLVVLLGDNFKGFLLQQMLFRHQLAYQDDVVHFLHAYKKMDYSGFFEMEKQGGVKFIIAPNSQPLYFNAFNYTFDQNKYQLEKTLNDYKIYRRKEQL